MFADNPYLKLLRIPNIFTVPADIVLGFLLGVAAAAAAVQSANLASLNYSVTDLVILIFSSITLYLGGLVSNDLFDIRTDKIERPTRPLSSGKVQKKHAIILLIVLFSTGFLLSLFANLVTAGISGLLIISIMLYNYKLKSGFLRPFVMGGIRSLNVYYGFSSFFGISGHAISITEFQWPSDYIHSDITLLLGLVLMSVFFHVFMLTWISSRETAREFADKSKKIISVKTVYYTYITFLLVIGSCGFFLVSYQITYLFFILALGIVVTLIFYKAHKLIMLRLQGSLVMQFVVKNMLLMLIILDSAFIAGISGPITGIMTAFLILPSLYLSKKISMT